MSQASHSPVRCQWLLAVAVVARAVTALVGCRRSGCTPARWSSNVMLVDRTDLVFGPDEEADQLNTLAPGISQVEVVIRS